MIEEIQKIIPWVYTLPLIPKIILSLIIISIAIFLLTLIWIKPPNASDMKKSNISETASVYIKTPPNNSKVPERPFVEGTVVDSSNVWVIVHPMETSDYWVQPKVSIKKDGMWKVNVYIGRTGTIDVEKHFEIMAVADPQSKLQEGDVLSDWPDAELKSQIIEVIRR